MMPPDGSVILNPASWTAPLDVAACFSLPPPAHVDVGCGRGQFLLARARRLPGVPFLGIEYKARRLRQVDRAVRQAGLHNVRLLQAEAAYAVAYLLPDRCVAAYYVLFPDPWPKRRHHKRRLFSAAFLDALHRTLIEGGVVHIATDHAAYGTSIQEVFARDARFGLDRPFEPEEDERTEYERTFLAEGRSILRLAYRRSA